jgi:hypothetical protein
LLRGWVTFDVQKELILVTCVVKVKHFSPFYLLRSDDSKEADLRLGVQEEADKIGSQTGWF